MSFRTDIDALAVGAWLKAPVVSGSKIQDVFASPNPGGAQTAITTAWVCLCFDHIHDDLIIAGQGGHSDYSGNEIYAKNLTTGVWRIKDFYSSPRDCATDIRYANGTPPSAHLYTCAFFNAVRNSIIRLPGTAPYTTGAGFFSRHVDEFDASVESPATPSVSWTAKANDADGLSSSIWAYHEAAGKYFGMYSGGSSSQGIRSYDPATNAHTTHTTFDNGVPASDRNMSAAICPRGVGYFAYMGTALQIKKLSDYKFAGTGDATYGATGNTAIETATRPAFVWDSNGNQFVAWAGLIGAEPGDRRNWYTMPGPHTGIMVWTRHSGTGDIPPAPPTNGVGFADLRNGCIAILNDTATEAHVFRASASRSVALAGTAAASISESDIVAGGKTIILTLTGETFVPAVGTPFFAFGSTKGVTAADATTGEGGGGARTGNGDITCDFPAGYAPVAGHFAIMVVYSDQGSGSTPTSWTAVTGSPFGASTEKINIFYKILTGSDANPVTTISGSAANMSHVVNMAIYPGVGSIGVVGTASNGTGSPMTAAAITTTANNSIVCCFSGRGDNEVSGSQTFNGSATGVNERLDGGTAAGNDSQVSMADIAIATSGSSSGAASSTTSATDPWVSVQIELKPSTPFADARAAIRNGLDSAQAEATGWDAKVKPNIPVANVVRTSDTVCTITLHSQSDYDITALETITATIPAAALTTENAIVAAPAFTISANAALIQATYTGSITPTGNLQKSVSAKKIGSITPTSALAKSVSFTKVGTLAPIGALVKLVSKPINGALGLSGILVRFVSTTKNGSLTPSGSLSRSTGKPLAGNVTPTGSLKRDISKTVAGALTPIGALVKRIAKTLTGLLPSLGTLSNQSVTPPETLVIEDAKTVSLTPQRSTYAITPARTTRALTAQRSTIRLE